MDSVQPPIVIPTKELEIVVPVDPTKKVESAVPRGPSMKSAKKVESVVPGDPSMKSGIVDADGTLKSTAGGGTKCFSGPLLPFADNTPLAQVMSQKKKGASNNKVKTRSKTAK